MVVVISNEDYIADWNPILAAAAAAAVAAAVTVVVVTDAGRGGAAKHSAGAHTPQAYE